MKLKVEFKNIDNWNSEHTAKLVNVIGEDLILDTNNYGGAETPRKALDLFADNLEKEFGYRFYCPIDPSDMTMRIEKRIYTKQEAV